MGGESFDCLCDKPDGSSAHDMDIETIDELSLLNLDQDFLSSDCSVEPLSASQRFAIMSTSNNGSDIFDVCTHSNLSLLGSSFSLAPSASFTASRDGLVVKSECECSPSTMHVDFTQALTIWSRGRDELSDPKAVEQQPSGMTQPESRFPNLHVNTAAVPHDRSHA